MRNLSNLIFKTPAGIDINSLMPGTILPKKTAFTPCFAKICTDHVQLLLALAQLGGMVFAIKIK